MQLIERDGKYEAMPSLVPAHCGVSQRIAQLLYMRGAKDAESVKAFLSPSPKDLLDPFCLPDMQKAVDRIEEAIAKNEIVCIFGDYDADGICATAIIARYLKSRKCKVGYHIPSRHEHGYGMSEDAIRLLAEKHVDLIITVDNGITAVNEIKLAKELGVDVIVTDHHRCQGELPDCVAVITHTRPDANYAGSPLCGAGVALKLIQAVGGDEVMMSLAPLAGLATIADIVPLTGENRILAVMALDAINSGNCNVGLAALAAEARRGSACDNGPYRTRDIAYGMVPRLNAAGRMYDARPGVTLFLTDDPDDAANIAKTLTELNVLRKDEEQRIYESAIKMIESSSLSDNRVIMLYSKEWNQGVIGISASRISERYYRPTMLFTLSDDGVLTGSARSIPGVDIFDALHNNNECLVRYGGHGRAAGATLRIEDYEEFKNAVDRYIRENNDNEAFIPRQEYELPLDLSEVTADFAEELTVLEPFGEGNPTPVFCTSGVKLRSLRRIGQEGRHIKAHAQRDMDSCEAIGYCMGDRFDKLMTYDRCTLAYTLALNAWRGQVNVQMRLHAVSPERIGNTEEYIASLDEKFSDAFLTNIMYNSSVCDIAYTAADADKLVVDWLREDICSSAVLCFTQEGAVELLGLIDRFDLWNKADMFVGEVPASPIAYNSIVLAPNISETKLSGFRRVLIYDSAITLGMLCAVGEAAEGAELYVSDRHTENYRLLSLLPDNRERMATLFLLIKELSGNRRLRYEDTIAYLAVKKGTAKAECRFALDVFIELGLLTVSNNELILQSGGGKKNLTDSEKFRISCALKQMNKEYISAVFR